MTRQWKFYCDEDRELLADQVITRGLIRQLASLRLEGGSLEECERVARALAEMSGAVNVEAYMRTILRDGY